MAQHVHAIRLRLISVYTYISAYIVLYRCVQATPHGHTTHRSFPGLPQVQKALQHRLFWPGANERASGGDNKLA